MKLPRSHVFNFVAIQLCQPCLEDGSLVKVHCFNISMSYKHVDPEVAAWPQYEIGCHTGAQRSFIMD